MRPAYGMRRGSWVTTSTPRPKSLRDIGQDRHDRLAVLGVERRGRLVGEDHRRIADHRARDGDALLLAARELARIVPGLAGKADAFERRPRLLLGFRGALAAHVEREPHVVRRGQRREQVIGLEHEADVLPPELRQVLGRLARDLLAADADGSFARRQHAAENGQQRGLAAAGRPHQQRQLAALEREIDALERAGAPGPSAEVLNNASGLHHQNAHRVNTMAGSMRVTFMIAAIAETTHIVHGQREQRNRQPRRDDDRQRAVRGHAHHQEPDQIRQHEADHRAQQGLADDDLVDVAPGRADRPQGGELVEVILGAGIERLRNDHGADDDTEQGAGEQRRAGAGAEQPELAAALAEFRGCQDLDVAKARRQVAAHLLDVGAGCGAHQEIGRLGRRRAGVRARPVDVHEHIGRGGERADAVRHRRHPHRLLADFRPRPDPRDTEPLEIGPVDRDRVRRRQRLDPALHHVPGIEPTRAQIRADHEHRRRRAARRAPVGKADHHRDRLGDARDRQRAAALPGVEQRGVLEALGALRHDPEIGRGVVDHGGDHLPEAEIEPHLHRHQHDGEYDADHGRDQAQPVVEQVSERKREDQRHQRSPIFRINKRAFDLRGPAASPG